MASRPQSEELKELWTGWHSISPPMRPALCVLSSFRQGARRDGFKDVGALWRGGYDMTPDEFSADLERLWNQVRRCICRCIHLCGPNWWRSMGRASSRRMGRFPRICSAQHLGAGVGKF